MQFSQLVVYITVPPRAIGARLAAALVENKLAACVNIIPEVASLYN
jgi:uncharacterized protein involved in tolerance to divalent cations